MSSKLLCLLLAIVACSLLSALSAAGATASMAASTKGAATSKPGESTMEPAKGASSGQTKRAALRKAATKRAASDASARGFQSRMMQAPDSVASGQFEAGSDAWNAHNLEPTFTDQEQGDEMVALASDVDGNEQQIAQAPPSGGPLQGAKLASSGLSPAEASGQSQESGRKPAPERLHHDSQRISGQQANKQQATNTRNQASMHDEYEADEDEEDEEPAGKSPGGQQRQQQQQQADVELPGKQAGGKGPISAHEFLRSKEAPKSGMAQQGFSNGDSADTLSRNKDSNGAPKLDAYSMSSDQFGGFADSNKDLLAEQPLMRPLEPQMHNRTASKMAPVRSDGGWLPSVFSSSGSSSAGSASNFMPMIGEQPMKSYKLMEAPPQIGQPQFRAPEPIPMTVSAAASRPAETGPISSFNPMQTQPTMGGKSEPSDRLISSLFGGRDSLGAINKANVAIEYLKNILKHEPSAIQNTTQAIMDSKLLDSPSMQSSKEAAKLYRISSIASKITHILQNRTNPSAAGQDSTNEFNAAPAANFSEPSKMGEEDAYEFKQPQQQMREAASESPAPRLTLSQELLGLKPYYAQQQQHQAQQESQFTVADVKPTTAAASDQYALLSSTTKLPQQEVSTKQPQSTPAVDADSAPINGNPSNGTPLGGDYIESLDEFPRGLSRAHSIKQHQETAQTSSSPAPAKQSPPTADYQGSAEKAPAQFSEKTREQHANQATSNRMAQQQQYSPPNLDSLSFEQSPYEASFQAQQQFKLPGIQRGARLFHQMNRQAQDLFPSLFDAGAAKANSELMKMAETMALKDGSLAQHPVMPDIIHESPTSLKQLIDSPAAATAAATTKIQAQPQRVTGANNKSAEPEMTDTPSAKKSSSVAVEEPKRPVHAPEASLAPQTPKQATISSKMFQNERQSTISSQAPAAQESISRQLAPKQSASSQSPQQKPPKIVSYNYFESPTDTPSEQPEPMPVNYQLGDALYSSSGGLEHILSNTELEAIQNQFMNVEHPVVPMPAEHQALEAKPAQQATNTQEQSSLSNLLASLKHNNLQDNLLQRHPPLSSPRIPEDMFKEMESSDEPISIMPLPRQERPPRIVAPAHQIHHPAFNQQVARDPKQIIQQLPRAIDPEQEAIKKKKSLIVYLNHPRPVDMPKSGAGHSDSFAPSVATREFDSHGFLGKDSKSVEISKYKGNQKDADKDGLSVVVIGDAYKYKKIVLLISSKTGGLKFIPMVKDMKRK